MPLQIGPGQDNYGQGWFGRKKKPVKKDKCRHDPQWLVAYNNCLVCRVEALEAKPGGALNDP